MSFRNILAVVLLAVLSAVGAHAQTEAVYEVADSAYNIIDAINLGGSVTVLQPQELNRLVGREMHNGSGVGNSSSARAVGYRIQVFSDNNVRTAKANAEYRKRLIETQMPEIRGYMTFESPYWRVRVGDFRSQAEAAAVMRELKSAFPAFANDLRLVREHINIEQP